MHAWAPALRLLADTALGLRPFLAASRSSFGACSNSGLQFNDLNGDRFLHSPRVAVPEAGPSASLVAEERAVPSDRLPYSSQQYAFPGDYTGGARYKKFEQLWKEQEPQGQAPPPFINASWGGDENKAVQQLLTSQHPSVPAEVVSAICDASSSGRAPTSPSLVAKRVGGLFALAQKWPGLDPIEVLRKNPGVLMHSQEKLHQHMRQYDDQASAEGLGLVGPDFPAISSALTCSDPRRVAKTIAGLVAAFPLHLSVPFPGVQRLHSGNSHFLSQPLKMGLLSMAAAVLLLGKQAAAEALTKDLSILNVKPEKMRDTLNALVNGFKLSGESSEAAIALVTSHPAVLTLDAASIESRCKYLANLSGTSPAKVLTEAVLKDPTLLLLSYEKLQEKRDALLSQPLPVA